MQRPSSHPMTVETIALVIVVFVAMSFLGARVAAFVNVHMDRAASAITAAR